MSEPITRKEMVTMKLFVWVDVLHDYSAGMIVALAPDLETALACTEHEGARRDMGAVLPEVTELGAVESVPKLWFVHGGG
jgi:hypothetical protein